MKTTQWWLYSFVILRCAFSNQWYHSDIARMRTINETLVIYRMQPLEVCFPVKKSRYCISWNRCSLYPVYVVSFCNHSAITCDITISETLALYRLCDFCNHFPVFFSRYCDAMQSLSRLFFPVIKLNNGKKKTGKWLHCITITGKKDGKVIAKITQPIQGKGFRNSDITSDCRVIAKRYNVYRV